MGPRRMRQSTAGQIEKDRLGTKLDLADNKCDLALDDNKHPTLPATNRIVNIKHKNTPPTHPSLLNKCCLLLNPVFESVPPANVFVFQPQNKRDYQSDFNGQDLHRWNSGAMRR